MGKMKEKGGYVYFIHYLETDVYITYGVGVAAEGGPYRTLAEAKKDCIGYYLCDIASARDGINIIKATTKKKLVEEYMEELKNPTQEDYEEE